VPSMYGLEYTLKTCETCLRDCNADDEDMTELDGGPQCSDCRVLCDGYCGEYITDETVKVSGPLVKFRDYLDDGKLAIAHAECAALLILTNMGSPIDLTIEEPTREQVAEIVEVHTATAYVMVRFPMATCAKYRDWFYILKTCMVFNFHQSNVIGYGRTEREAWIDSAKEIFHAQPA
jgi:hypothetical protein